MPARCPTRFRPVSGRLAARGGSRARGAPLSFPGVVARRGETPTAHQRDRRNLTPDQLALVMGRHYNRTKLPAGGNREAQRTGPQKEDLPEKTAHRLASDYGVSHGTIERAGKFAAAVEWIFAYQRDRRNLTPDQLALVMGRHYNRTKQRQGGQVAGSCSGKANTVERTSERLAETYGVHPTTIIGHGKFAAAVETLKAVRAPGYPGGPDGWRPRAGGAETAPLRSGGGAIRPKTRRPRGSLAA